MTEDLLGDLGASLAADLLAPPSDSEMSEEGSEVQVSDALESMSIESDPVDAGSAHDPLSVPTADHTGALCPLTWVWMWCQTFGSFTLEVRNLSIFRWLCCLFWLFSTTESGDKDRLWDLDIYLNGNDHTDAFPSREPAGSGSFD